MEVDHSEPRRQPGVSFAAVIVQIVLLDLVFSIDSVITAVGMARALSIMVAAVVIAVVVMLIFAGPISASSSGTPASRSSPCRS
jgi:predicted tellurium resistance membrane protein TerC